MFDSIFVLAPPKLASLPIAAALWSKPCKCATGKRTAAISALLPKYRLWYALSWFPVSPIDLLQLMCHTPTEEIVRGAVHCPDSMGVRDPTNCGAAQRCLDRGNWRDLARAFYPPGGHSRRGPDVLEVKPPEKPKKAKGQATAWLTASLASDSSGTNSRFVRIPETAFFSFSGVIKPFSKYPATPSWMSFFPFFSDRLPIANTARGN